jgi:hypothetical protein
MRPVERETVFGGYRGEPVMIIATDDPGEVGADAAMCEIEYYAPLAKTPVGTRAIVHLNAVEFLYGRGATRGPGPP